MCVVIIRVNSYVSGCIGYGERVRDRRRLPVNFYLRKVGARYLLADFNDGILSGGEVRERVPRFRLSNVQRLVKSARPGDADRETYGLFRTRQSVEHLNNRQRG